MSREDAAKVYVDVLLGNRGAYADYLEALESLTPDDRTAIETAVSIRPCPAGNPGGLGGFPC